MPGERPSHTPPENPFRSEEGKLPPEPTAKFVERYLGKGRIQKDIDSVSDTSELATDEERRAAEEQNVDELVEASERSMLYEDERKALSQFFGREIKVPELPQEITAERRREWRELGFELHYLPPFELKGNEPGLKVPVRFDVVSKDRVDLYGPNQLKPLELPGAWVLVDSRLKPNTTHGKTQRYPDDLSIETIVGGSRFLQSWSELRAPAMLNRLAKLLKVAPGQVRFPRAVEFNTLGNLHHPEWGTTGALEWFEDTYESRRWRLSGGRFSSRGDGLGQVKAGHGGGRTEDTGFRLLIVISEEK